MKCLALLGTNLLLILALVSTWPVTLVTACECPMAEATPQGQFAQAEMVFSGKVIAGPDDPRTDGEGALLEVLTIWKGDVSQTTQVVTAPFCNLDAASYYRRGETYLIYGGHSVYGVTTAPFLSPLPCGRTGLLSGASADLAVLGKGRTPAGSARGTLPASGAGTNVGATWWLISAILCSGLGLALTASQKKHLPGP